MYAEQVMINRREARSVIMQDLVIEYTKDNDADLPIRKQARHSSFKWFALILIA